MEYIDYFLCKYSHGTETYTGGTKQLHKFSILHCLTIITDLSVGGIWKGCGCGVGACACGAVFHATSILDRGDSGDAYAYPTPFTEIMI